MYHTLMLTLFLGNTLEQQKLVCPDSSAHFAIKTKTTNLQLIFFQTGKKLMKMSMPFAQKIRVYDVDHRPSKDDIRAYLYTSDDNEWKK